jgi:hypothetical protein
MGFREYIIDNPRLDDVAIFAYAALRAAIEAGAHPALIEHLLNAFKTSSGAVEITPGDLSDTAVLTQAALDASARADGYSAELLDSLLEALREIEKSLPSNGDATPDGVTSAV